MIKYSQLVILLAACLVNSLSAQSNFFITTKPEKYQSIGEHFRTPEGYTRIPVAAGSFAAWLRDLTLLPDSSAVLDYRGRIRVNATDTALAGVVAMNIRHRRLDQCMDVIMRFHVLYLMGQGRDEEITLPLPDGLRLSWKQWAQGYRPQFAGLHFSLKKIASPDSGPANFERYLRTIFDYTGTQAFYHYYPDVHPDSVRIGDFFVKKGYRGHAVLIVDMAENLSGERIALIGQGDTPACQFYILNGKDRQPWIPLDNAEPYLPIPIKKKMGWDGLRRFTLPDRPAN